MTLDHINVSLAFSRALVEVIVLVHGTVNETAAPEPLERLIT